MSEPLRKKVIFSKGKMTNNQFPRDAFFKYKDIELAVNFYKEYRYKIYGNIQSDYPQIWKEWNSYLEEIGKPYERYDELLFSNWFFDYCFKDVIE